MQDSANDDLQWLSFLSDAHMVFISSNVITLADKITCNISDLSKLMTSFAQQDANVSPNYKIRSNLGARELAAVGFEIYRRGALDVVDPVVGYILAQKMPYRDTDRLILLAVLLCISSEELSRVVAERFLREVSESNLQEEESSDWLPPIILALHARGRISLISEKFSRLADSLKMLRRRIYQFQASANFRRALEIVDLN